MFTALGSYRGVAYTVTVGDAEELTGSPALLAALRAADGQAVLAGPTGPELVLRPGEPASTWAWLRGNTLVVQTEGDLPPGPPRTLGTVH